MTASSPSFADRSSFQPRDPAQREAHARLLALHQALEQAPAPGRGLFGRVRRRLGGEVTPVRGLYFWGGVGRGKTHLMDWFVEGLELPGKRRMHFHHFMREVHGHLARLPRQTDPLDRVAELMCRDLRVLCLDEFLVTDITDAMLLYGLLKAMFARGVTLVTTSNTPPDDLYRNGLQRQSFLPAIDLINRHTDVFELDGGQDYRLQTLMREGVYVLAGEDGDARLAIDFDELSGGHRVAASWLEVNGRTIEARALGSNVAWFDFDALCATPRSTADYIEIARDYLTVLISGVPQLGPGCDAAARRFLHLVDELYDRRVKLVLSVDVPLDQLYAGGMTDFAHARLLSRLQEMQSVEYLAAATAAESEPDSVAA
ncbi:hypothetical protein MARPU_14785 [Marichromatium purpuratum 984]|uniref:ATPase n=1 Tax=Marichromatium purpuratum 984 TaxID=765910 RepID=W0E5Z3_MARPU|nr:cell division protein ZapE [Marichromatium purpuratum]AHF04968.1 hypothetical protein MARPU_14785 [Marichromatium purpuratum 984]